MSMISKLQDLVNNEKPDIIWLTDDELMQLRDEIIADGCLVESNATVEPYRGIEGHFMGVPIRLAGVAVWRDG